MKKVFGQIEIQTWGAQHDTVLGATLTDLAVSPLFFAGAFNILHIYNKDYLHFSQFNFSFLPLFHLSGSISQLPPLNTIFLIIQKNAVSLQLEVYYGRPAK